MLLNLMGEREAPRSRPGHLGTPRAPRASASAPPVSRVQFSEQDRGQTQKRNRNLSGRPRSQGQGDATM